MADHLRPGEDHRLGFRTSRVLDAPRERVWREWTEPECFADWFGGPQVDVPLDTVSMDVRPGGAWRLTMLVADARGEVLWHGRYREVVAPERLVFTISDLPPGEPHELVTVELIDLGGGRTEMRFEQRGHHPPEVYERAGQGWSRFFDRVAERLAAA
jgi:uncharacterized protein YndB with AHSA1/START domain